MFADRTNNKINEVINIIDLTKVKNLVYRGYRRFLMPMNVRNGRSYVWSFLYQTGNFTTYPGRWEYELPSDFNNFTWGPVYGKDSNYPNPNPISMDRIKSMRSFNSSNSCI